MIESVSFTKEWILGLKKQKRYSPVDPVILEKRVYAFALLEALKSEGLNFVFKGGSCLPLVMEGAVRFSADIDIMTLAPRESIENILTKICSGSHFTGMELDEPRSYKGGIPQAHYMVFYNALFCKSGYIVLDIIFDRPLYPEMKEAPLKTAWLNTCSPDTPVQIPSVNSLVGDKLTAFAPETTGIPFGHNRGLEIVKQMYDLGRLFDSINDFKIVAAAFNAIAENTINCRSLYILPDNVIDDTIRTALLVAGMGKNNQASETTHYNEIVSGLLQFKAYLGTEVFRIEEAVEAAAKIAYMAAKIKATNVSPLKKFRPSLIKNEKITHPEYEHLNQLQRINNGAFFYWKRALSVIGFS